MRRAAVKHGMFPLAFRMRNTRHCQFSHLCQAPTGAQLRQLQTIQHDAVALSEISHDSAISQLPWSSLRSEKREPVILRPYQEECIKMSLEGFKNGNRRQVASLPVGSGKTVIFAKLIPEIEPPTAQATKTLILAHRTELLQQARETLEANVPDLKIGIEEGSKRASMDSDVILASVNTLGRTNSRRLARYDPSQFKAIIVDEAHHVAAIVYQRILEHFGAHKPDTHLFVWGCSATVRRHDGRGLQNAFDKIVYHQEIEKMIRDEWLCEMKFETLKTDTDLSKVKSRYGDFDQASLAAVVDNEQRNEVVLRSYLRARDEHGRRSVLIFAASVQHIHNLQALFQSQGVDAVAVHGNMHDLDRRQALESFRLQRVSVLINCGIVTEGVDIPAIDCIILARPTKSTGLLQQMIGRGFRKSEGKDYCLVIDVADNMRPGVSLATVPVLMGLNPNFDFEDRKLADAMALIRPLLDLDVDSLRDYKSISDVEKRLKTLKTKQVANPESEPEAAPEYKIWLQTFENPFDVNKLKKDVNDVTRVSRLAWVRTGPTDASLEIPGNKAIAISREEETFIVTLHQRRLLKKKGDDDFTRYFWKKKKILEHDTLEYAIRAADSYIMQNHYIPHIMLRSAPWRTLPATPQQLRYLERSKIPIPKNLTKGEAADLLTRRWRGAQMNAEKARREAKKKERALQAWNRLQVKVGDL